MRRLNGTLLSFDDREPTIEVGTHTMTVRAVIAAAANRSVGRLDFGYINKRQPLRAINGRPC